MALTATLFSANAGEVLSVVYPAAYQAGSHALAVVAFGMLFFGFLYVLTTIISASGRPIVSVLIAAITLVASAALNAILIPPYGLVGAAVATTASMLMATAVACTYVGTKFGALISIASTARIVVSAAVIYIGSRVIHPTSKVMVVGQLAVLGIGYCGLLILTREIGRKDLRMIARVIGM